MSKTAIVLGAGGAVGEATALALLAAGWRVRASVHRQNDQVEVRLARAGAELTRIDLTQKVEPSAFAGADAAVLTPILTLSARALPALQAAGVRRVIAFSSNNVAIDPEAPTYVELAAAERALRLALRDAVILRPTLIYGDPRLATLTRVARLARRSPVLPVPGTGAALQQPVHHEDLARAAAWLAQSEAHGGATFTLGGPDVLSMRALFAAIAKAAGAASFVMPVPRWMLGAGRIALKQRFPFDWAQIARANVDRVAVEQTPPPAEIVPRTPLAGGLARLVAAMDAKRVP